MIMAVASPQVELLISLFFSEDDVNFSYVSYISTSGITTLHTQDIFLEKIKNHANNLIGDHISKYSTDTHVALFLSLISFSCKKVKEIRQCVLIMRFINNVVVFFIKYSIVQVRL